MTLTESYNDILDFLAAGTTPRAIADFRPSAEAQARVRELIERKKSGDITPTEEDEMQEYLDLEHLMIMAKARAHLHLQRK